MDPIPTKESYENKGIIETNKKKTHKWKKNKESQS